jgi:phosphatidate cytidylyltransferase
MSDDPYAAFRRTARGEPAEGAPVVARGGRGRVPIVEGGDRYAPTAGRAGGAAWAQPATAPPPPRTEHDVVVRPRGPGRRRAGRPPGRAGRNLPAAIGVGVGLALVVLASLVLWKPAFLAVIAAATAVGIWETVRALRSTGANPPLVPLVAGGLLMIGLAWWAGVDALTLGLLVTVPAAAVWRVGDGRAGLRRDLAATALIAVYVPFLLGFGALLVQPGDGVWRVLCTLLAVVLSDTGGYAAGVFLGRHPMAPSISPKKSWEGFAGSVVAAALGSALLLHFTLYVPVFFGALFGVAIAVVAVLGDLAESMLKRDLGIKDMSQLLPGHGGLMDRLDSILFAVPTAYLLLSVIAAPR